MAETRPRPPEAPFTEPLAALARQNRLAGLALLWERLWPRLWLPVTVTGLFLAVAWLGGFALLSAWPRLGLVALFVLATLLCLLPLRRLRPPSGAERLARLERDSGLAHQPLAGLADRLATDAGPEERALWAAHRRRLAASVGTIRVDAPSPRVDRRDRFAMRAGVFLLLLVGLVAARHDLAGPVAAAFALPGRVAPPIRLDAWVTPPGYTGRPAVFLTGAGAPDGARALAVPSGSVFTVRFAGVEAATATFAPDAGAAEYAAEYVPGSAPRDVPILLQPGEQAGGGAEVYETVLDRPGRVTLAAGDTTAATFDFTIVPDAPPTIALTEPAGGTVRGALRLAYEARDDYGVVSARAIFIQPGSLGARPLVPAPEVPLSVPRRDEAAETFRDLSAHPWAGSEVVMVLEARDAAGQTGTFRAEGVTLPVHPFREPLARALVEQRRDLALDARSARAVADLLDAMTLHGETFIDDAGVYLGIRSARARIVASRSDAELVAVVDLLWQIALAVDGGEASLAEERLREAREALREALQNGASPEEIARLTEELREALDAYMQALAEQARQGDLAEAPPRDPNARTVTPEELQSLAERIEELAELGDREAAEALLQQLDEMLENLQTAPPQQGQSGSDPSNELLDELGEMIEEQQRLMDETYDLGRQDGLSPEARAEALEELERRQSELGERLGEMMGRLAEEGLQPGEGFGEAGRSMERAERRLGRGDSGEAVGEQGQALEALREGARQLGQQMAGEGQGGSGEGQAQGGGGRDPLGRPERTSGPDFGDDVRVPDEIDVQRARRILDELRRRFGDAGRPELELDYLERLLEPF